MSLTRKMLKAMSIEEEKIDEIIEAHIESLDNVKDKLKKAEEKLADYDTLKAELDAERKKSKEYDTLKADYEAEKEAHDKLKKELSDKAEQSAKEEAGRKFFESKGIKGNNLEIAMRASKTEISALELENGEIKDNKALDELVSGALSGLVVTESVSGVKTSNPIANVGNKTTKTKEEISQIKDTAERQKAMLENKSLYLGG